MNFSIHQASCIGNRKFNQDRAAYAYDRGTLLMVLADGMGGHLHGELAAGIAIETFMDAFGQYVLSSRADPQAFIAISMRRANQRIHHFSASGPATGAPGSTCVVALVQDGKVYWGHAGDSRLYLLRDGAVAAVTRDHSMVQQLVEWGNITSEEARVHPQRNQITNCLGGIKGIFYIEAGQSTVLHSGDVLLLGSDGLWGALSHDELAQAFMVKPVAEVLDGLIAQALVREAGHADNVTGIAMRWGEAEPAHDDTEPVCNILEIH